MDALRWDRTPALRRPTMICAFKGWNDAAESATGALEFVGRKWEAQPFAAIETEEFLDFQVTRPTVRLTEGQTREIVWPEVVLSSASIGDTGRDAVLLEGTEPNLRWKGFCTTIVEAAQALRVEMLITFGALLADVPHTRDVRITGIAGDERLVERLGFSQIRYEGPTGIVGVLHNACASAGLPCASLWAPVPHYVAALPSPKAALALLRSLEQLMEVGIDVSDLEQASGEYEQRLDEAVAADPDVRSLVERLEQQMDEETIPFRDIPTGDSLAREFQRFLRERGKENGG